MALGCTMFPTTLTKGFGQLIVLLLISLTLAAAQDSAFWNGQAQQTLSRALGLQQNRGIAKNVIFFLGDGMDIQTITASRIYRGQLQGRTGEEEVLSWEEFPHVALSKTYNTNAQVGDSAGTATAFFSGVKTKAGVVGVDDGVTRGDCASMAGRHLDSLLTQAYRSGKATGFITTARVTHATPSALYAHSPDRNWEIDAHIPQEEAVRGCKGITRQLVEDNAFINLILGGGRSWFLPNTTLDPEYGHENVTGDRQDGRDMIATWLAGKDSARYVWNQTAFDEVDPTSTEYLLGLFEPSHMQYELDRPNDTAGEPSILEMTEKAINLLKKNQNGYFLMVEGGRIDHAHHEGFAKPALADTLAFDLAVAKAVEMTNSDDTLIIVTADHAHTMTIGGYPTRGNPIFGYDDNYNGSDSLPYLTLTYGNGPGGILLAQSYNETGKRPNHLESNYNADKFLQDAASPIIEETHGGDDVGIYALGPWAHLFHGVHEQNYIAHVVRYAACYKDDEDNACNSPPPGTMQPCTGSAPDIKMAYSYVVLPLVALFCVMSIISF